MVKAVIRGMLLALAACLSMVGQLRAEEVVMPYRCDLRGGAVHLVPSERRSYQIFGRREHQAFRACSRSDRGSCKTYLLHRFDMDCGGARVAWVDVIEAALDLQGGGQEAWVEGGRVLIDVGQVLGSTAAPRRDGDEPYPERSSPSRDRWGARAGGYSSEPYGDDYTADDIVELPAGYAPTLGIGAAFVDGAGGGSAQDYRAGGRDERDGSDAYAPPGAYGSREFSRRQDGGEGWPTDRQRGGEDQGDPAQDKAYRPVPQVPVRPEVATRELTPAGPAPASVPLPVRKPAMAVVQQQASAPPKVEAVAPVADRVAKGDGASQVAVASKGDVKALSPKLDATAAAEKAEVSAKSESASVATPTSGTRERTPVDGPVIPSIINGPNATAQARSDVVDTATLVSGSTVGSTRAAPSNESDATVVREQHLELDAPRPPQDAAKPVSNSAPPVSPGETGSLQVIETVAVNPQTPPLYLFAGLGAAGLMAFTAFFLILRREEHPVTLSERRERADVWLEPGPAADVASAAPFRELRAEPLFLAPPRPQSETNSRASAVSSGELGLGAPDEASAPRREAGRDGPTHAEPTLFVDPIV